MTVEQMIKAEARELRRFAVKHHSGHATRNEWCRKCERVDTHDYGRFIKVVPERSLCCDLCRGAQFAARHFNG